MVNIEFNQTDYAELLQHFAEAFQGSVKDNILQLPAHVGEGFIKLVKLPNGLQCLISDYVVYHDIQLSRTRINQDFYTLRFDEMIAPKQKSAFENSTLNGFGTVRSAVFLGSTKFDWKFMTTKGTRLRGVNILFTKVWLEQFVGVENVGDILKKYFSLKMSAYTYEALDMEYKHILAEIILPGVEPCFEGLVVQNRIMLLLERYFTNTYNKINQTQFNVKWSNDDISRLNMVKAELISDFSAQPAGIPKLAELAAMSQSKLKNCFREVFGLPVYQYFQKQRMQKAKAMLLSKKYNVREVGYEVGYSNLSNFAKAFRKAFDQLPSDLLDRQSNN